MIAYQGTSKQRLLRAAVMSIAAILHTGAGAITPPSVANFPSSLTASAELSQSATNG